MIVRLISIIMVTAVARIFTITQNLSSISSSGNTQTLTIPYLRVLDRIPQIAYGISCLSGQSLPISVTFNTLTKTIDNVTFTVTISQFATNFCINLLINTESQIEIGTFTPSALPHTVLFEQSHQSPRFYFFPMSSSSTWSTTCMSSEGMRFDSTSCNAGGGSLSYVLIDQPYFSSKFGGLLPVISANINLNWNYFYSDESMIFAHVPITSTNWLTSSSHNQPIGGSVYLFYSCIGYSSLGTDKCTFLILNPEYTCKTSEYFSYVAVDALPIHCKPCHPTCNTCINNPLNITISSSSDCLSCSDSLVMYFSDDTMTRGQCLCSDSTTPNTKNKCIPCNSSCLNFNLRSITTPDGIIILMSFSMTPLVMLKPLQENLALTFNEKDCENFKLEKLSSGDNYLITVDKNNTIVDECTLNCKIVVLVKSRSHIRYKTKALNIAIGSVDLSDVSFTTNQTLKNLATATQGIITFAFLANAAKYVKVLFQMQQLIQYHKYLNLTLPINFQQLLIDMSGFEYVNIFDITNVDIYGVVGNVFGEEFDYVGDMRLIHYSRGNNFAKNMVECLGSFVVLLLFNYLMYLVVCIIRCGFCVDFKTHLEERKLNTLNDSIEGIIMPIVFYSNQQLTNVIYQPKFIYLYLLVVLFWIAALTYPILIALTIYKHRKNKASQFHNEDLMMDCDLNQPFTYILYVSSFYRKILFVTFLTPYLSGAAQMFFVLSINLSFLLMLIYTCCRGYHSSKIKIALKITFNSAIVIIDFCLFAFRKSFLIGEICKYFSFIAIFPMLSESILKLFEAAYNILRLVRVRQHTVRKVHPARQGDMEQAKEGDVDQARHNPESLSGNLQMEDDSANQIQEIEGSQISNSHMEEIYLDYE